eukprot:TRINITY_DN24906_c0_g1_i2.p1 TRINITY_DN24906_c0_g1~~TRINITY_DN24906_c0_g1_i2.p1  ORF type:complete len:1321 (-),score=208.01 TRINITY_DN24906_c0_g1_i2:224-4186(-)
MQKRPASKTATSETPVLLYTFGSGSLGELGIGAGVALGKRREATCVAFPPCCLEDAGGGFRIDAVALGTDHSLALVKGRLYRWGLALAARNDSATGEVVDRYSVGALLDKCRLSSSGGVVPSPTELVESVEGTCAIACGGSNSFMVTEEGAVYLLGDLPRVAHAARPAEIRHVWGVGSGSPSSRVVSIAAGWRHCLILTQAGRVFAIGDDEHGQCAGVSSGEVAVAVPTAHVLLGIAAGACHSVAWDASGAAFAWGHGGNGRLGLGGTEHRRSAVRMKQHALGHEAVHAARCGANFTFFATGPDAACVTCLWACGGNQYGQLGLGGGDRSSRDVPVRAALALPLLVPEVEQENISPRQDSKTAKMQATAEDVLVGLECGANHVICLTRSASNPASRCKVWTWGCASSGQCGRVAPTAEEGDREDIPMDRYTSPGLVLDFAAPQSLWAVAVAAGRSHSAVLAQELANASPLKSVGGRASPSSPWQQPVYRGGKLTHRAGTHGSPVKLQQTADDVATVERRRHFLLGSKQAGKEHHLAAGGFTPSGVTPQDDIIDQFLGDLFSGGTAAAASTPPSTTRRRSPRDAEGLHSAEQSPQQDELSAERLEWMRHGGALRRGGVAVSPVRSPRDTPGKFVGQRLQAGRALPSAKAPLARHSQALTPTRSHSSPALKPASSPWLKPPPSWSTTASTHMNSADDHGGLSAGSTAHPLQAGEGFASEANRRHPESHAPAHRQLSAKGFGNGISPHTPTPPHVDAEEWTGLKASLQGLTCMIANIGVEKPSQAPLLNDWLQEARLPVPGPPPPRSGQHTARSPHHVAFPTVEPIAPRQVHRHGRPPLHHSDTIANHVAQAHAHHSGLYVGGAESEGSLYDGDEYGSDSSIDFESPGGHGPLGRHHGKQRSSSAKTAGQHNRLGRQSRHRSGQRPDSAGGQQASSRWPAASFPFAMLSPTCSPVHPHLSASHLSLTSAGPMNQLFADPAPAPLDESVTADFRDATEAERRLPSPAGSDLPAVGTAGAVAPDFGGTEPASPAAAAASLSPTVRDGAGNVSSLSMADRVVAAGQKQQEHAMDKPEASSDASSSESEDDGPTGAVGTGRDSRRSSAAAAEPAAAALVSQPSFSAAPVRPLRSDSSSSSSSEARSEHASVQSSRPASKQSAPVAARRVSSIRSSGSDVEADGLHIGGAAPPQQARLGSPQRSRSSSSASSSSAASSEEEAPRMPSRQAASIASATSRRASQSQQAPSTMSASVPASRGGSVPSRAGSLHSRGGSLESRGGSAESRGGSVDSSPAPGVSTILAGISSLPLDEDDLSSSSDSDASSSN